MTKRAVLSTISRLFDLLGLASVVSIKARVAFQEIWKAKKYDWDDPLPDEIRSLWYKFFQGIEELNNITIPRCLRPHEIGGPSELQVFVIFSTPRSPHQGGIYETLIKQVKRTIRVVVGSQRLSWNEMSTVFELVKFLFNSGIDYGLTNRFCQDPVEQYFGKQRLALGVDLITLQYMPLATTITPSECKGPIFRSREIQKAKVQLRSDGVMLTTKNCLDVGNARSNLIVQKIRQVT